MCGCQCQCTGADQRELGNRAFVTADFSYGGAFYCLVSAEELGFASGLSEPVDIALMNDATRLLKAAMDEDPALRHLFAHPDHSDLRFLYAVIIVDAGVGRRLGDCTAAENGLCFFGDQEMDRSPTGSGVAARVALRYANDKSRQTPGVAYHSLLSNSMHGKGGFIGRAKEDVGVKDGFPIVTVKVEGFASYVGTSSFVIAENDPIGIDGFLFDRPWHR